MPLKKFKKSKSYLLQDPYHPVVEVLPRSIILIGIIDLVDGISQRECAMNLAKEKLAMAAQYVYCSLL